ncbi:lactosylceramide 1,3-N-acetyl-beta-D-glucosaminyltransferase-like [Oppia nitens]|uniref:lactosylceramide 1,3-N-acetyl-beta-D-glucosaminyltransferase-like n=1 Tax=Oppia nitens TaxID=1686743 RepID=UPI0023DC21C3|nr:lactosylceramide 1,3-N-acetyl-beta-D-glucosaminyltransferase-like [Oppia nitens]
MVIHKFGQLMLRYHHNSDYLTINEIWNNVKHVDNQLKSLSKIDDNVVANKSRFISAQQMLSIDNITINKKQCNQLYGKDLLLVVMVFTRVNAFSRRKTIRETWAQDMRSDNRTRVYFAIAHDEKQEIQEKVILEDNEFNDIIQFGYNEDYFKCTIKSIGLLRWTAINCPFVKYMMKLDDDSFIISDNLMKYVETSYGNSIIGHLWTNVMVKRNPLSKWYLSYEETPNSRFPDFIGGPSLIPGCYCLALYETTITQFMPALPFEDVLITGLVANHLNIKREDLISELFIGPEYDVNSVDICQYQQMAVIWQRLTDKIIRRFWQISRNFLFNCYYSVI